MSFFYDKAEELFKLSNKRANEPDSIRIRAIKRKLMAIVKEAKTDPVAKKELELSEIVVEG